MGYVQQILIPLRIFNKTIPTQTKFFRFPIHSMDSLLTHLRMVSLSNVASNLK